MSVLERRSAHHESAKRPLAQSLALWIFALMAVGAPLAFGAVDRFPQIVLVVLLLLGILLQPPGVVPLSGWGNRLALALVVLVIFKEFAPSAWFGDTLWRSTLTRDFGLNLPGSHHPEPGRAIDGLLAAAVALIWFLWVRRLATDRENRARLALILVGAASVVALVSFALPGTGTEEIFGFRYTPGWSGFGPFPNRNHSASYFAMAAVLGCGCIAWAGRRGKWLTLIGLVAAFLVILVALLTTESRGGLLAFGAGLAVFLLLVILKLRDRRALAVGFAAVLVAGAMALAFGSQVLARFQAEETSTVSNATRLLIWKDAIAMWRDAPLLGHGLGAFAPIFPLYMTVEFENEIPIHPESSWLQWLTELGAVPLLIAVGAVALFFAGHVGRMFARNRSFFLHAGGFAAVACLLVHGIFDVPAHRWATAGFALAALAIACPLSLHGRRCSEPRQAALIPLAVALYWAVPFFTAGAPWSPTALGQLLARQINPPGVLLLDLEESLRWFPLDPQLHQAAGFRLVRLDGRDQPAGWQKHFAVAARLTPGSWEATMAQARAVQRLSPFLALPYWQQTVARGGIHREEVFATAWQQTAQSPAARTAWGRYVEANPPLLLTYIRLIPERERRYYFSRWWRLRGAVAECSPTEIRDFYALIGRWGDREQLEEWMKRHPTRDRKDFYQWARLLHGWGDDARAWQVFAAQVPEPAYPGLYPTAPRPQLEEIWRSAPQNLVNAQQLAQVLDREGDTAARDAVVLAVATGEGSQPWFVQKAAHTLARRQQYGAAVQLLLKL